MFWTNSTVTRARYFRSKIFPHIAAAETMQLCAARTATAVNINKFALILCMTKHLFELIRQMNTMDSVWLIGLSHKSVMRFHTSGVTNAAINHRRITVTRKEFCRKCYEKNFGNHLVKINVNWQSYTKEDY